MNIGKIEMLQTTTNNITKNQRIGYAKNLNQNNTDVLAFKGNLNIPKNKSIIAASLSAAAVTLFSLENQLKVIKYKIDSQKSINKTFETIDYWTEKNIEYIKYDSMKKFREDSNPKPNIDEIKQQESETKQNIDNIRQQAKEAKQKIVEIMNKLPAGSKVSLIIHPNYMGTEDNYCLRLTFSNGYEFEKAFGISEAPKRSLDNDIAALNRLIDEKIINSEDIESIYAKNYYQDKLNTICEITAEDISGELNYTKSLVSLNNLYNKKKGEIKHMCKTIGCSPNEYLEKLDTSYGIRKQQILILK